jgi:hypothetical protein
MSQPKSLWSSPTAGARSSLRPHGAVTLVSGSGGGSVSVMGSPAASTVPRFSKTATHARPSRRDGKRTALAPLSNKSAPAGGDLVQIKVTHAVLEQQLNVAFLDLLAGGYIREVD